MPKDKKDTASKKSAAAGKTKPGAASRRRGGGGAPEAYDHPDKEKANIMLSGLAAAADTKAETKNSKAKSKGKDGTKGKGKDGVYEYGHHDDPHLPPHLSWAGKTDSAALAPKDAMMHEYERIEPAVILAAVQKREGDSSQGHQGAFFDDEKSNLPLSKALECYQHKLPWSNRLIAGDSLLVMNSLLQREYLRDGVQMVYMDPPYGIKYGSNFQAFASIKEVKDGKDLTTEVETLKAFRDAWELGTHSYLTYLRDRLMLARELLTNSGSCFVQIGKENVHRVALLMDEIFGAENRVATISYATSGGSSSKTLPEVADYLLWYAKNKGKVKYRQIYEPLTRAEIIALFNWHAKVELPNGECRKLTDEERFDPDKFLPEGARLYRRVDLKSQGGSNTDRSKPYKYNGRTFPCKPNEHWRVSKKGLDKLAELGRLEALEGQSSLMWKWYEDEVPGRKINNIWARQMSAKDKHYVVETAPSVIQRCVLMTTDPGDLVFDPTCGSGTTPYVAEQWGRRWIAADTSRISIALARHRLMTAVYDYYALNNKALGVGGGFIYDSVSKVSAGSLAYNKKEGETILYDQPEINRGDKNRRVAGPFTVEALPAPVATEAPGAAALDELRNEKTTHKVAATNIAALHGKWLAELKNSSLRGKGGEKIEFARLGEIEGMHLHGEGETKNGERVLVCFGPEHAAMPPAQVDRAMEEAAAHRPSPKFVVFAAFRFDPQAERDIENAKVKFTPLKVGMNTDLQTEDLKKKSAGSQSFWLVGRPDVTVEPAPGGLFVARVNGYDYFNVESGKMDSGDIKNVVMWMLDTNYNGRSIFARQVFFPMKNSDLNWEKLEKDLRVKFHPEKIKAYEGNVSLPFAAGEHKRIAVKIIDERGIESMAIEDLQTGKK